MPTENRNHPEDHAAIERLHQQYVGKTERFSDELMVFQDAAYAMGLDRGAELAKAPGVTLAVARTKRVYVAGPMTGIENFNYPAFNAAADALRAQGYQVTASASWIPDYAAQWLAHRFPLSTLHPAPHGATCVTRGLVDSPFLTSIELSSTFRRQL